MARKTIYGAIPLANGYWCGQAITPDGMSVSCSAFHDEEEAREWGEMQAGFYGDLDSRAPRDKRLPEDG